MYRGGMKVILERVVAAAMSLVVAAVIAMELRNGSASIRGPDYARDSQPVMFWAVIALHLGILGVGLGFTFRPVRR